MLFLLLIDISRQTFLFFLFFFLLSVICYQNWIILKIYPCIKFLTSYCTFFNGRITFLENELNSKDQEMELIKTK